MQHRELREDLLTGFGRIRPTSFGSTAIPTAGSDEAVASPTTMPAPMAPGDPRRDESDPWAAKGLQPGTTTSGPGSPGWTDPEPAPTSQVGDYLERFPTPQLAWQDWIKRMGQFLARQPGETPNFPGPWGSPTGSGRVPTRPGPRGGSAGGSGGRFMGGRAPVPGGSRGPDFQNIRLM